MLSWEPFVFLANPHPPPLDILASMKALLQCAAVCCSVLQCVAMCAVDWTRIAFISNQTLLEISPCPTFNCIRGSFSGLVAACCSVLQCVAVCCSVLQCVCCVLQCVAPFWVPFEVPFNDLLQCVALCCSVLQCVAVCGSVWQWTPHRAYNSSVTWFPIHNIYTYTYIPPLYVYYV